MHEGKTNTQNNVNAQKGSVLVSRQHSQGQAEEYEYCHDMPVRDFQRLKQVAGTSTLANCRISGASTRRGRELTYRRLEPMGPFPVGPGEPVWSKRTGEYGWEGISSCRHRSSRRRRGGRRHVRSIPTRSVDYQETSIRIVRSQHA